MIDEAKRKAIVVLEHCVRPVGFFASGLPGGYEAVWARDSMIASLGASLLGKKFQIPFRKSLELLGKNQGEFGQIPNAVGSYNAERGSDVTFNAIDANLWYIIGHHVYKKTYNDNSLYSRYRPSLKKALTWLKFQDPNNDSLIVQQPTSDWQDAFPHKYGRAISTQALYYVALKFEGEKKRAEQLKKIVNGDIEKYLSLYDAKLGYYRPWRWKTHNKFEEGEYWFDTFGNLMAIVTGLTTPKIAKSILVYIDKQKINRPYPCKAIYPPIKRGDKEWQEYFEDCEAREPYAYLNGGIWPFIGGFYVAALVKVGEFNKAESELAKLAEANKLYANLPTDFITNKLKNLKTNFWGFQEWLHGQTGKPAGGSNPYQAWSAGMYVYAYECVKRKKVFYF